MHTRESAVLKDVAAALGFHEGEPQQHDHQRRQLERVRDEFFGDAEWRIGDDRLDPGLQVDCLKEVAGEMEGEAVVFDIDAITACPRSRRTRTMAPRPAAGSHIV
jgi:hypothetical protein